MTNENTEYVSAEYLRRAAELGRAFKQRSHELLRLESGDSALDVGCGPGVDTGALAALVGDTGRVVGVDLDPAMIAEADARIADEPYRERVRHQVAGADELPFGDQCFDGVRAERLLQVLPERELGFRAVAEMNRVLKPGGRLVLADADWGSASVDFSDAELERRLLTFFADRLRPNGYAGREMLSMVRRQGLQSVEVEVMAAVHPDLSLLPFDNWLPDEAVKSGVATEAEAAKWKSELAERIAAGEFYATVNLVLVSAVR